MGFSDLIRKSPTEWPVWEFHPLREETESTHQAIFVGEGIDMISAEVKLCECGCGNPAPIAKWNKPERGEIKGMPLRFISGHNLGRGKNSINWKGGTHEIHNGYVQTWARDNPMADCRGYVLTHRLLAEKALGKTLPEKVQIHHYDKIQIVICQDDPYHKLLHQRTRALRACGHANWRKCWICKEYGPLDEMIIREKKGACHRKCDNEYQRKKHMRRRNFVNLIRRERYAKKEVTTNEIPQD